MASSAAVKRDVADAILGQSGDFVAETDLGNRVITINAGQTTATFGVQTVDDDIDEEAGAVTATLSRVTATRWRPRRSAYFGEVEHAFRGCGTRISAKWNARRSAATLSGRSLPFGSRGVPEILPVPPP